MTRLKIYTLDKLTPNFTDILFVIGRKSFRIVATILYKRLSVLRVRLIESKNTKSI